MQTVSQLVGGIRGLCAFGQPSTEPTEEQLSTGQILGILNDEQASLINEATLSQQNAWLQFQNLGSPGVRDVSLTAPNFNSLVMVEYQIDPTYDRWLPLSIINRVELSDAEAGGNYACSIYGTPPRLTFNFIPAVSLPTFNIRYWYETNYVIQKMGDRPQMAASFYNVLKYASACLCREVLLGLPWNNTLHKAEDRYREQYNDYVSKAPDQRPQPKPTAYGIIDDPQPWRGW